MLIRRSRNVALAALIVAALAAAPSAQAPKVTSPKDFFGFTIGDDYQLANYTQLVEYWHKLERESPRMKLVEIGKTSEGRPHLMAIISSPENLKKLDSYKDISARLAHAEGLTDDQARQLAKDGKAVVWIDGGLHATEVLGAHQLLEMVYQLVSRNDAETQRFLNDVILLCVHANPDGMELVSNWYMREKDPAKRSMAQLPRLYNKYAGHDDNRDFYMSNLAETTNMNRVMFTEWFPQIVYNHHQTGPAGTVMFAPPFRDPFNFNFDPQVPIEIDLIGAALNSRMVTEGKPGVTTRKGSSYSTWWNGGLRTIGYFHNMIGLLTETIGNPTPMTIPFIPSRQLPDSNLYSPIEPQVWHFRQSIDYSITANRAVLDIASRDKENFLFNIYRMGKNSIERGGRDSWTITPRRVLAAEQAVTGGRGRGEAVVADAPDVGGGGRGAGGGGTREQFDKLLRDPAQRDARVYILPSDQPDFPTATRFVNALIKTGVAIHRTTAPLTAGGRTYPTGSFVIRTAQAFRPHVMDMFEPQDHPDDIPYPGGPPTPPYDNAGYTLAYQMGVKFDRLMDDVTGSMEKVNGLQKPMPAKVTGSGTAGYLLSHATNDAFIAINRLLAAGEDVSWVKSGPQQGSFYIAARPSTRAVVEKLAADLGVGVEALGSPPAGDVMKLRTLRIGLSDRYGGSMPSGWTRWLFEQFEFPFEVVYPKTLDAGNLASKFDVLVFPSDMVPAGGGRGGRGGGAGRGGGGGFGSGQGGEGVSIPAEYQNQLGAITASTTVPQLKKFLEDGGTIVAVGRSTSLAALLGLPIENHLAERAADGAARPISREKYYVPGSILRVAVDNTNPVAHGFADHVDVFFDNSPVFDLAPDAALKGIRPVAWFDSPSPLRSGWAWGQGYLDGGIVAVDAPVGRGRLFLFAPEITFRAQPHGTFKFLFNGIYLAGQAAPGRLGTTAGRE
ncbi:MAG: peptidase [Acidobacteria bacterium]|nr:MAG: peptidase [Acidobacteriota bacterium]